VPEQGQGWQSEHKSPKVMEAVLAILIINIQIMKLSIKVMHKSYRKVISVRDFYLLISLKRVTLTVT